MTAATPMRGRVDFEYEAEFYGARKRLVLPFAIGILADIGGPARDAPPQTLAERRFVQIDRDTIGDVQRRFQPAVTVALPDDDRFDTREATLTFPSLDDFSPVGIANQLPPLKTVLDARTRLREIRDRWVAGSAVLQVSSDLQALADELPRTAAAHIGRLLEVDAARAPAPEDLNLLLAITDDWLGEQVSVILHQPALQQLEATWRALVHLANVVETSFTLRLEVLNVTKAELQQDRHGGLASLTSILASNFTDLGGEPFALLVADLLFSAERDDIALLSALSEAAEANCLAFLAGAAPELLACHEFGDLHTRRRLSSVVKLPSHHQWGKFVRSPGARSVALMLPRVLGRDVHAESGLEGGFRFVEHAAATADRVWINPAFLLAARIAQVFDRDNWWWPGDVERRPVTHLATSEYAVGDHGMVFCCPLEASLPDAVSQQLEPLGFVPLRHQDATDSAYVGALRTVGRAAAGHSRSNSEDLPTWLNVTCLIRYLRCVARDSAPDLGPDKVAEDLNRWLRRYVASETATDETAQPLLSAELSVAGDGWGGPVFDLTVRLAGSGNQEPQSIYARVEMTDGPPLRSWSCGEDIA